MKRVLVIGCNGFIGNACASYFYAKGYDVSGADITIPAKITFPVFKVGPDESFFDALFSFFDDVDICINASGAASVAFSLERPAEDRRLNVENVKKMLDAIAQHTPQTRFLNFSSAAVYGNPASLPVDENAALSPLSPYGEHKLECERLLVDYAAKGLKTCNLRVFSAYGPGLRKQLFWDIFQKAKANSVVRLFGTGNESRDFIFIDDLVRAVELIAERAECKGESINVASGTETTIRTAAETFLELLGNRNTLEFSGEEKAGDPRNWKADISRLAAMGFSPAVGIREGLEKTIAGYRVSSSES